MNTRILLDGWLDGALRSYGYMAGVETLKNFLRGAAEVALSHVQEAAQAKGVSITGQDLATVLQSLGQAETALDIMSEGHIELSNEDGQTNVTFIGCPYATVCAGVLSDLIGANLPRSVLPCFRAEMCGAALATVAGVKSRYKLDQFAPGDRCRTIIELV